MYAKYVQVDSRSELEKIVREGEIFDADFFQHCRTKRLAVSEIYNLIYSEEGRQRYIDSRFGYRSFRGNLGLTDPLKVNALKREEVGRKRYARHTGHKVVTFKNFVNRDLSWLIASPDGMVYDKYGRFLGGLEVKSVFCHSTKATFPCQNEVWFDGVNWQLTKLGKIYCQIQMAMVVCNITQTDLVVNFYDKIVIITVPFDAMYVLEKLSLAKLVYVEQILPIVCGYLEKFKQQ
jgi:hypothetical protein